MHARKPTIPGEWADLFLLNDEEDYFLYPTKDSDGWQYEKLYVIHSKDLYSHLIHPL